MGSSISVYNSTIEAVRIKLVDDANKETDCVLAGGQLWEKKVPNGYNTVFLLPLENDTQVEQHSFCYTIESGGSLVVKHKSGKLVLVDCLFERSFRIFEDYARTDSKKGNELKRLPKGCLIFNECDEPVNVSLYIEHNKRNSQMIIGPGEYNFYLVKESASLIESPANSIMTSVADLKTVEFQAVAKYTVDFNLIGEGVRRGLVFLRIAKTKCHFQMEWSLVCSNVIHYIAQNRGSERVLLTKKYCQRALDKFSVKANFRIIPVGHDMFMFT